MMVSNISHSTTSITSQSNLLTLLCIYVRQNIHVSGIKKPSRFCHTNITLVIAKEHQNIETKCKQHST